MSASASDDDEPEWWSGHEALLLSAGGADAAERTTLPQLVRAGHERLRPAGDQRRRRRCAPRGDHVLANALVTPLGGKEQAGGYVGMGTPIVS
jgi:hypothetical protein